MRCWQLVFSFFGKSNILISFLQNSINKAYNGMAGACGVSSPGPSPLGAGKPPAADLGRCSRGSAAPSWQRSSAQQARTVGHPAPWPSSSSFSSSFSSCAAGGAQAKLRLWLRHGAWSRCTPAVPIPGQPVSPSCCYARWWHRWWQISPGACHPWGTTSGSRLSPGIGLGSPNPKGCCSRPSVTAGKTEGDPFSISV